MPRDEAPHEFFFLRIFGCFKIDHLKIAPLGEISFLVDDVGDASAHSRREIASRPAENGHAAACHVLAAVIANAFDNSDSSAVTDSKTLSCDAADESLTRSRSI